jgi:hypothetical protein
MKSNFLLILSFCFLSGVFMSSCSSKNDSQTARLQVRLTDAPASYDAVLIDIKDVQINVTGDDDKGWQSLAGVKAGVYNLLDLVNGKDTLLIDANIPTGRLHQIRLVLGTSNSIVVNGVTIPLQTPSAEQSGLKLNVQQDVTGDILYTMTLDFDAARSIVQTGSNQYILKPVIRTLLNAVGGSIKGAVLPQTVRTSVFAIQGNDTLTTFTDSVGRYLIRGVPAGTYTMQYWPIDSNYNSQVKTGVAVTTGNVTVVDTVRLQ